MHQNESRTERKRTLAVFVLAGLLLWIGGASRLGAETGFRVIVHQDNPAQSLSKKRVSRMLLKEISKWDGGLDVKPIDLAGNSPTRRQFSKDVHGRSVSSIKNYWQRQIFSGREVPPPEVGSDTEVIEFVRSNPGGIGYVSPGARLSGSGVKVLDLASK